jgi:predicted transglutaminase-like cysteine proteinase
MGAYDEMIHSRFMDVIHRAHGQPHWYNYLVRKPHPTEEYINSSINRIPYDNKDMYAHRWDTPEEILAKGYACCVGYSTTKYLALRKIGYAKSRMKFLVVYIKSINAYHAILVLDNERVLNNIEKKILPLSYYDVAYRKEAWTNELNFGEYR